MGTGIGEIGITCLKGGKKALLLVTPIAHVDLFGRVDPVKPPRLNSPIHLLPAKMHFWPPQVSQTCDFGPQV